MAQRRQLDTLLQGRIIGRLEAGQTQTEVSRALNVPQSVISRLWRRFQDTGDVRRIPVQGRPRVTTPQQDRYVTLTARRNRRMPARQLSSELAAVSGVRVSRQTVYRRLRAVGLYARRPAVCVPLTRLHIRSRLQWSQQHRNWTLNEWRNVMFTDESRFSLHNDSRRAIVWRERGTRFNPTNIVERYPFGGGGVLVWGGIMFNGRTDLHVFAGGTVTAQRYRDEVLEPYVRLFRGAAGPHFIFMDDNARPHRAHLVDEFLEREDIHRMDWPARSPDINPIEHAWDALGRRVAARQPPPRTIPDLRNALHEEWGQLPVELLNHLIESMPRRCEVCVAMRGNHTPY